MTSPRAGREPAEPQPATQGRLDLPGEASIADSDLDRLRRYLKVNSFVLAGSVISLAVLQGFLRSAHLLFVIICLAVVLVAVITAWRLAVRRRPEGGAQLLALATWMSAIGITAASPFILPASSLWVLMPIVLPLVVLTRRIARRILVGTVLSAVLVVAIGTLIPDPFRIAPPMPVAAGIVIGTVVSITVVIAYSLALSFERSAEQRVILRDSRKRIISAAYDARRQIERDLHDGAQQRLVSTSVRLALVGRLLRTDPLRAETTLAEAAADLKLALQDLRELAHGIYPPLLVERGLGPALTAATRPAPFPVNVDVPPERLPMDLEATLYFCCLEGVQNAVKHASPTQQWISMRVSDGYDAHPQIEFSIRDDGVGFDSSRAFSTVGLTNINDRVEAVGGVVTIEAAPGHGTQILGHVPLPVGEG